MSGNKINPNANFDADLLRQADSADGTEEHVSFCSSEGLGYTLLSDPGGVVSERYGSWSSPFSQRHTFLIDPDGILRARWEDVSPSRHSQDVLRALNELQQS